MPFCSMSGLTAALVAAASSPQMALEAELEQAQLYDPVWYYRPKQGGELVGPLSVITLHSMLNK
jgi:hypothetical protein